MSCTKSEEGRYVNEVEGPSWEARSSSLYSSSIREAKESK